MVGVRGFEPPASTSRMRTEVSELGLTSSFSSRVERAVR